MNKFLSSQFIRDNIKLFLKEVFTQKPFVYPNRISVRIFKIHQNVSLLVQVSYRNTFNVNFTFGRLEHLMGNPSFSSIPQFEFTSSLHIR